MNKQFSSSEWVPETRFGKWFLSTGTWFRYVLGEAVENFESLLDSPPKDIGVLLDAGCGQGQSFSLLDKAFKPDLLIGIDVDPGLLASAKLAAEKIECPSQIELMSADQLSLEDASVDVIFCHQLIHHVANQDAVLQEFLRVLAPGGKLLISESCKPFIDVWTVRWFFRHPMEAQKTADEYIALVRAAGFVIDDSKIKVSSPWWSLADLGVFEKLGLMKRAKPQLSEQTELLMIVVKP